MQFIKGEQEFNIKAHLRPDFSCLFFPGGLSRARRNSVDLFQEAVGMQVKEVIQFSNERSFLIKLENQWGLLFKMHGNRANIILMQSDSPFSLFNNKLVKDQHIKLQELHRNLSRDKEVFAETNGNYKKLFPTLGKLPEAYFSEKGYEEMNLEEKWVFFNSVLDQLENPQAFFVAEHQGKPVLSLLKIGKEIAAFSSPVEALNRFFILYTKEYTLELEKLAATQKILKILKSSENYLAKTSAKLQELQNSAKNRELADIIMANLHAIPPGTSETTLFDFYHDQPVTIKLKKDLSPQKNAENFYRKAKNQQTEEEYLKENIRKKEDKVLELEEHLEKIEKTDSLKDLRAYLKETSLTESLDETTAVLPYRTFEFSGFHIWVGKGATQNDAMLRYHSHKDDLWLHAKDVAGSHVLIKKQPGTNVPPHVKEKAASLAAWYSKRKNDSLCPVTCTPVKWIRKRKGAPPGAVVVEKEEEVLLVPPASFRD